MKTETQPTAKHTQGEWKTWINEKEAFITTQLPSDDKKADITIAIAKMEMEYMTIEERNANAQRIVKCVNMHEGMVDIANKYLSDLTSKKEPTDKDLKHQRQIFELLKQASQK